MTPAIAALLKTLGFQPTPGNPNTWYRNIPEAEANGIAGVRAYIKFGKGKWKGFQYYTVKGCTGMMFYERKGFHTAIGELKCLRLFKQVRDLMLANAPISDMTTRALYLKAGLPGKRIEQMYNEQAGNRVVGLVKA